MLIKRIFLFLFCFLCFNTLYAEPEAERWQLTSAEIKLIKNDSKELNTAGTVLGKLLEENKRTLWSLKEEDGTILSLSITYQPAGRPTPITQIGFYRTFDLKIQQELEAKGIQWQTVNLKIAYQKIDPITIRFLINGDLIKVPPLLTKAN